MLQTRQILNNRYRIVALIGQGGFGAVYRASDINLNMARAVKENLDTSPEAQQQFQREAQILAGLRHPNLPAVTDYFFIPNLGQYLVMDFVEGQDLEQVRQGQGGKLDVGQVLNWVGQVCQALGYLHSQNPAIIHRDIKPANIKITPQGKAVLVDFGISKIYDPRLRTTVGARAITPGYSPIEQYGQGQMDARSDIYALGATLYTLLTGQEPPEATALLSGAASLTPPRQLNPAIPGHLAAAIEQAMNSKPTNRYQAVADFQQALAPPRPAIPVAPPPISPYWYVSIGLGAAGLLFLLVLAVAWPVIQRGLQPTATIPPVAALPLNTATLPEPVAPTDTPTATNTSTPPAGDVRLFALPGGGGEVAMVYVPAGTFLMGSTNSDSQAYNDEFPQHRVDLDDYWLDRTEVTNAMYEACVAAGVCTGSSCGSEANQPVNCVTWADAKTFCEWRGANLPTEAQWEKGARGTDGQIYPWGNESPTCDLLNYSYCVGGLTDVGSYPNGASPYGALDMAGNVWEWVADWYDSDYYATSPDANPTGPSSGDYRVVRGGSWLNYSTVTRAAYRGRNAPDSRIGDLGFRCVVLPGVDS